MLILDVFRARAEDVARALQAWAIPDLLAADPDEVTERFVRQFAMQTHPITGEAHQRWKTPGKPSDGVVVVLPIDNPQGAQRFFEYEPSTRVGFSGREPPFRVTDEGLTFEVSGNQDAKQLLDIHTANIKQRNQDVEAGNRTLPGLIRPVVLRVIESARSNEERAAAKFLATGIPMLDDSSEQPRPAPDRPDDGFTGARETDSEPVSESSEIVGRVTPQAIRLHNIDIVLAAVRDYIADLTRREEFELAALYSGVEFQLKGLRGYVEKGLGESDAAEGIIAHLRHVWERMKPIAGVLDKTHKAYVIYKALEGLL